MTPAKLIVAVAVAVIQGELVVAQETGPVLNRVAQSFIDAQVERSLQSMNSPFKPFRVIGNIHYVGASDVSSFLITTREGHILIDSGFEATVPMIRDAVSKLGFRFEDIKILLNSHARPRPRRRSCVAQAVNPRADRDERGGRCLAGPRW